MQFSLRIPNADYLGFPATPDAIVTAAQTERIKLATSVLILPHRNPILTAKTVATLDQFSKGRIILGVGAGWVENEFDALAINFADRRRRTDEYLRVCKACWGADPIS